VQDDLEHRLINRPESPQERAALRALVRLRSEGKSVDAIAAGVKTETGIELSTATVDRILREVAGPAPREKGGDPEFFSGYLGGG
jgi:hypothetical protein